MGVMPAVSWPQLDSAVTSVRGPHCKKSPITLLPPAIPTPNPAPATLSPLATTSVSSGLGCPAGSHSAQLCPNPPVLARVRIHNMS